MTEKKQSKLEELSSLVNTYTSEVRSIRTRLEFILYDLIREEQEKEVIEERACVQGKLNIILNSLNDRRSDFLVIKRLLDELSNLI